MNGKFSRHQRQVSWRTSDIVGYLLLIGCGTFLGYILGGLFTRVIVSFADVVLGMLAGQPISGSITGDHRFILGQICGVGGAIFIGHRLSLSQSTYYRLVKLKAKHRQIFSPISDLNPVVFRPFFDALWAVGWVLAETLFPLFFTWIVTVLVYTVMKGSLSFYAIIPALVVGFWFSRIAGVLAHKLFNRNDLEEEIKRAPQLINTVMNAEENKAISLRRKRFYELPTIRDVPARPTKSTTTIVDPEATDDDLFV